MSPLELEREKYEARLKAQRDARAFKEWCETYPIEERERGRIEGLRQAREEARAEGHEQVFADVKQKCALIRQIILQQLAGHVEISDFSELIELPREQLQQMLEDLTSDK